jgi:hypothetical protein
MFEIKIKKKEFLFDEFDLENTIDEAIEFHYSYDSCIELIWNKFSIYLSYSIVGDIYYDIINMLDQLNTDRKEFVIGWPCNAFFADWEFNINENDLSIKSFWVSVSGGKDVVHELKNNISDSIKIDKSVFINEWVKLLDSIKVDLSNIGYKNWGMNQISNGSQWCF